MIAFVAVAGVRGQANAPAVCDVRTLGACGDGRHLDTAALQQAIDLCHARGGGTVRLAGGRFLTGTLYLRSNVTLRVEAGAVLLGSPHIADYGTDTDRTLYRNEPHMDRCLLFARGADNLAIEGLGAIDGQGGLFPEKGDPGENRPKLIRLINCTRLRLRDVELRAPAAWTSEWRYCDDVVVEGVTIHSRANINGDGLDFDGCTRVRVSNSAFDTSDDSICLQTSLPERPCRDVVITNCVFSSRWAGLRIGVLSRGDFENIAVANCTFRDHRDSGLKIQMGEGAEMRNMTFSNLAMKNVPRPVFITFCQKNAWVDAPAALPPMKRVSGLHFSNITVDDAELTGPVAVTCGFQMTGLPGHDLEDLTFSEIDAVFPGGGTPADARNVPAELTPEVLQKGWPEYSRFGGTVPAFGFFARHVRGLALRGVRLRAARPDARPALKLIDVIGASFGDPPGPPGP